jgi:F-type H+-transporting ATPase subunit b
MLIDWFTVGAQILNFLILVWLMKRFLYQPILHAIDEREKKVAAELADAHAKKAESKKERDEFARKNEEFDSHHAERLKKVANEAKAERTRLLEAARVEADELKSKRQLALLDEFQHLKVDLTQRTKDEVFGITRKALSDLASASLEDQILEVFLRKLHHSIPKERGELQTALKPSDGSLTVKSTFELVPKQRDSIESAIKDLLQGKCSIQYETAPQLLSGIELSANGWKLSWTIDAYLGSFEKNVEEALKVPLVVKAKTK